MLLGSFHGELHKPKIWKPVVHAPLMLSITRAWRRNVPKDKIAFGMQMTAEFNLHTKGMHFCLILTLTRKFPMLSNFVEHEMSMMEFATSTIFMCDNR